MPIDDHPQTDPLSVAARNYAAGREEAFTEVVTLAQPQAQAIAVRLLGESHAAEDAVQEALLALWREARRYDGHQPFAAWVARRVRFTCRARQRSDWRRRRREGLALPPPPADAGEAIDRDVIVARVAELPESLRRVVDLHYYAGLSQAETAAVLGLGENAVAVRLHRARARLARTLGSREAVLTGLGLLMVASPCAAAGPVLGRWVAEALALDPPPPASSTIWSRLMHRHPSSCTVAAVTLCAVLLPLSVGGPLAEEPAPAVREPGPSLAVTTWLPGLRSTVTPDHWAALARPLPFPPSEPDTAWLLSRLLAGAVVSGGERATWQVVPPGGTWNDERARTTAAIELGSRLWQPAYDRRPEPDLFGIHGAEEVEMSAAGTLLVGGRAASEALLETVTAGEPPLRMRLDLRPWFGLLQRIAATKRDVVGHLLDGLGPGAETAQPVLTLDVARPDGRFRAEAVLSGWSEFPIGLLAYLAWPDLWDVAPAWRPTLAALRLRPAEFQVAEGSFAWCGLAIDAAALPVSSEPYAALWRQLRGEAVLFLAPGPLLPLPVLELPHRGDPAAVAAATGPVLEEIARCLGWRLSSTGAESWRLYLPDLPLMRDWELQVLADRLRLVAPGLPVAATRAERSPGLSVAVDLAALAWGYGAAVALPGVTPERQRALANAVGRWRLDLDQESCGLHLVEDGLPLSALLPPLAHAVVYGEQEWSYLQDLQASASAQVDLLVRLAPHRPALEALTRLAAAWNDLPPDDPLRRVLEEEPGPGTLTMAALLARLGDPVEAELLGGAVARATRTYPPHADACVQCRNFRMQQEGRERDLHQLHLARLDSGGDSAEPRISDWHYLTSRPLAVYVLDLAPDLHLVWCPAASSDAVGISVEAQAEIDARFGPLGDG